MAGSLIGLLSVAPTLLMVGQLLFGNSMMGLFWIGGPLGLLLAMFLGSREPSAFPLGIAVAISWAMAPIGTLLASQLRSPFTLSRGFGSDTAGALAFCAGGLLAGLFLLGLLIAARQRPGEEGEEDDPDGFNPPPRLPIPDEGMPHPVAGALLDAHMPKLQEQWPGFADEAQARALLPIHAEISGWYGLRRDAAIIEVSWHEPPRPDALAAAARRTLSLVVGAKRYPELGALLPRKPEDAKACASCEGEGRVSVHEQVAPVPCRRCNALGWTRA